jgi:hypothetical protein
MLLLLSSAENWHEIGEIVLSLDQSDLRPKLLKQRVRDILLRVNEYTPLAWPVPRMVRVGRGAVLADRGARGIVPIEAIVAVGT